MTQRFSVAARLWRILTRSLDKALPPRTLTVDILSKRPTAGFQPPEEGTNHDYELFCRVSLGDKFNDDRYIALRKLGYGQYSTVWLARDSR